MVIPTVRHVDHFAFTVPDLDRAISLFSTGFGAVALYRQGPVEDPDGDFMARQLAVHPRASCHVSLLRLGPNANLELFSYRTPGQRLDPPLLSDVGGHEITFAVTDLDLAVRWASRHPHLTVSAAADFPQRSRALETDWGMRLAFVERVAPPDWPGRIDCPEGVPGLLGVAQVTYTVADLDAMLRFLTTVVGGRLIDAAEGPGFRSAILRLGPAADVELREYERGVRTERPRNSDVGGHHLAFYVDDVPAASRYLAEAPDVRLLGEPQVIAEGGPIDGAHWQYFLGPGGFQFELTFAPPGLPYEATTRARRFRPARDWDDRDDEVSG